MKSPRGPQSVPRIVATVTTLWVITVAGLALGWGYAVGVTPWNAPDEPAHYNYVRYLATTGQLPELKPGDWDSALLERLKSARFPKSESIDSIRYENWQPPIFYAIASPLYNSASRFQLGEQVVLLRLLSVAISGITVVLAFFAVRRIFPEDLVVQLAVPAFIAFLPMRSAIAGSINNDALAEMLSTLILLQMVGIAGSGLGTKRAVLLGLILGATLLTKATIYGFVPLALGVGLLFPARKAGSRWRPVLIAAAVALLASGWWFVRNVMVYGGLDLLGSARHDQVVVGQPRLEHLDGASLSYFGGTLFKSFWGIFGWMGIVLDERIYFVLGIVSGLATFGLVLFLWRVVFEKGLLSPHQRASLAIMGAAIALVVAQLIYYNLTYVQAQGRYLFPALLPIALFFVLGLRELMAPIHARLLLALSGGGLALLNLVCLTRYVMPYFR